MSDIHAPPGGRSEVELRRLFHEQAWPREARHDRLLVLGLILGILGSSLLEARVSGLGDHALTVIGLRILACLTVAPLGVAAFAARRPAWVERARLLVLGGVPLVAIAILHLHPTQVDGQSRAMMFVWAVLGLVIRAPLRYKLPIGAVTYAAYVASLYATASRLGDAYGKPNEIVNALEVSFVCVLGFPLVPYQSQVRRFREFVLRYRTDEEIALRKERERLLAAAKEAAERAEEEARAQKERAARAAEQARRDARARAELFADMSHELRTPMAGILGLVELIRATPLTEEQAHYVETIRASNRTLLSLLDDVLDSSSIEEGALSLAPAPVVLADVLRAPAELLRANADRKGIALRVELGDGLPRHVRLDPARIQQILLNLLGNALKFTRQGSVTLRASAVEWAAGRGRLRVEIEDTGSGFSREQGERLFQRFRQADDATAQKFGGSGLGLSICKGLVALMSGTIGAESDPGVRTVFWFEIPVEESSAPSAGGSAEIPAMRLLLAEDNEVNRMVIGQMLRRLGQQVTFADDGRQAFRLLTEQRFDMAIMDMQMPELAGDELTRQLRARGSADGRIYVVALTAAVTAEQQARYRDAGVDALYTKPIDMDGLRGLLAREGPRARERAAAQSA